jgi:hypothetical protein
VPEVSELLRCCSSGVGSVADDLTEFKQTQHEIEVRHTLPLNGCEEGSLECRRRSQSWRKKVKIRYILVPHIVVRIDQSVGSLPQCDVINCICKFRKVLGPEV